MISSLLKQPLFYQSVPFYGKNLTSLFFENFENLLSLYKWEEGSSHEVLIFLFRLSLSVVKFDISFDVSLILQGFHTLRKFLIWITTSLIFVIQTFLKNLQNLFCENFLLGKMCSRKTHGIFFHD